MEVGSFQLAALTREKTKEYLISSSHLCSPGEFCLDVLHAIFPVEAFEFQGIGQQQLINPRLHSLRQHEIDDVAALTIRTARRWRHTRVLNGR